MGPLTPVQETPADPTPAAPATAGTRPSRFTIKRVNESAAAATSNGDRVPLVPSGGQQNGRDAAQVSDGGMLADMLLVGPENVPIPAYPESDRSNPLTK